MDSWPEMLTRERWIHDELVELNNLLPHLIQILGMSEFLKLRLARAGWFKELV